MSALSPATVEISAAIPAAVVTSAATPATVVTFEATPATVVTLELIPATVVTFASFPATVDTLAEIPETVVMSEAIGDSVLIAFVATVPSSMSASVEISAVISARLWTSAISGPASGSPDVALKPRVYLHRSTKLFVKLLSHDNDTIKLFIQACGQ
jgi:hypothetical protein